MAENAKRLWAHAAGRQSLRKESGGTVVAITALHGLRGVGKTTLAAAYAEAHRGHYRATWWIRRRRNPPCAPILWRSAFDQLQEHGSTKIRTLNDRFRKS